MHSLLSCQGETVLTTTDKLFFGVRCRQSNAPNCGGWITQRLLSCRKRDVLISHAARCRLERVSAEVNGLPVGIGNFYKELWGLLACGADKADLETARVISIGKRQTRSSTLALHQRLQLCSHTGQRLATRVLT